MGTGDNRGNWSVGKQRGVVEEGGSVNLSVDNSGSLDHRLDNWGVGNSANWGGKGGGEASPPPQLSELLPPPLSPPWLLAPLTV